MVNRNKDLNNDFFLFLAAAFIYSRLFRNSVTLGPSDWHKCHCSIGGRPFFYKIGVILLNFAVTAMKRSFFTSLRDDEIVVAVHSQFHVTARRT